MAPAESTPVTAAAERAGLGGLGVLAVVSAFACLSAPTEAQAARQFHAPDASPALQVAAPQLDIGMTAVPAVTSPTESVQFPPPRRDPMVVATAVLEHHRLVILSLRGGLYGP